MFNEKLIDNIIKLGVRAWLKSATTRIEIKALKIVTHYKFKKKK